MSPGGWGHVGTVFTHRTDHQIPFHDLDLSARSYFPLIFYDLHDLDNVFAGWDLYHTALTHLFVGCDLYYTALLCTRTTYQVPIS